MGFFVRISVFLLLGTFVATIVGCSFNSPAAGLIAFLLIALMARKGVIDGPKTDDGSEDDDI
jgi:hypothetical protein